MTGTDPVENLFQALLTALITGVPLVVTINQLVLSQELGAVGEQRSRMDEALTFREDVEDVLDVETVPADPAGFLGVLVEGFASCAYELAAASADAQTDVRDEVASFAASLRATANEVSDELEGAKFGTFDVLSAALDYEYSWWLYRARRPRSERADALPDEVSEEMERLIDTLTLFGPAREHVKTFYFRWELVDLSRAILYPSVPAIVATVATILYLDASAISGTVLSVDVMIWTVSALATIALAPFMLLLSYVLPIATVAKRTLAVGPFILQNQDRYGDADERE